MTNMLMPGAGGLPSPSPGDDKPVPAKPTPNPIAMASRPRPRSRMMGHYGGQADAASAQFDKVKEAEGQITATRKALDGLVVLGDTVTQNDVVKAAAQMVAAGTPAVEIATILAEMPEQPQQLRSWIQEKDQAARQTEQKLAQSLNQVRHQMISTALNHLIAHSAEAHAMAQPAQGNA